VEEARSAADEALAALAVRHDADYASALAARLRMESIAFDPWMVVERAPRALALAKRVGSEEARVDIATSLGLAQGHLGDAAALSTILGPFLDLKAPRLPSRRFADTSTRSTLRPTCVRTRRWMRWPRRR